MPTLLHLLISAEVGPAPGVGGGVGGGNAGLEEAGEGNLQPRVGASLPWCAGASHSAPLPEQMERDSGEP